MSYYCRYYALQEGINLRSAHPNDPEIKKYLIAQMETLEKVNLTYVQCLIVYSKKGH